MALLLVALCIPSLRMWAWGPSLPKELFTCLCSELLPSVSLGGIPLKLLVFRLTAPATQFLSPLSETMIQCAGFSLCSVAVSTEVQFAGLLSPPDL